MVLADGWRTLTWRIGQCGAISASVQSVVSFLLREQTMRKKMLPVYTVAMDPGSCPYLKIRHSSKPCICRLYETNSILNSLVLIIIQGFPGGSDGKTSACNAGDPGSIPGSGKSPGEGNGNSLQYSCLENSMDGGAWQATVLGVTKSQSRLSNLTFTLLLFKTI